ncbi:MAG: hypothetical protein EXS05_10480 [Planctomycetaceae bacterium]|nr:hypothetical protein [Planctomycetaceae bacterium]
MLALLAGCPSGAKAPPEIGNTVPVTGVVTLDEKPLGDAQVKFHPESKSGFEGAAGITDASGKYELSMITAPGQKKKSGIVPGKYQVTVSRFRLKDDKPMSEAKKDENPTLSGVHETAPLETSFADRTNLSYDVPAAGGTYDIPLKSQ